MDGLTICLKPMLHPFQKFWKQDTWPRSSAPLRSTSIRCKRLCCVNCVQRLLSFPSLLRGQNSTASRPRACSGPSQSLGTATGRDAPRMLRRPLESCALAWESRASVADADRKASYIFECSARRENPYKNSSTLLTRPQNTPSRKRRRTR